MEYGSGLHRAIQAWFTRVWDSWDEAPDVPRAEVLITDAAEILPGDEPYRVGLAVAEVREDGIDSDGEPMVAVSYDEAEGTGRWRASRRLRIVRRRGVAEQVARAERLRALQRDVHAGIVAVYGRLLTDVESTALTRAVV